MPKHVKDSDYEPDEKDDKNIKLLKQLFYLEDDILCKEVDLSKIDLDSVDKKGYTFLMNVISKCGFRATKFIEKIINTSSLSSLNTVSTNVFEDTPLSLSCRCSNIEIVELLLKKKVNKYVKFKLLINDDKTLIQRAFESPKLFNLIMKNDYSLITAIRENEDTLSDCTYKDSVKIIVGNYLTILKMYKNGIKNAYLCKYFVSFIQ